MDAKELVRSAKLQPCKWCLKQTPAMKEELLEVIRTMVDECEPTLGVKRIHRHLSNLYRKDSEFDFPLSTHLLRKHLGRCKEVRDLWLRAKMRTR